MRMAFRKLIALAGVMALTAAGCTSAPRRRTAKPARPPAPEAAPATGAAPAAAPETGRGKAPAPEPVAAPAPEPEPEPDYSNEPLPEPEVSVAEVQAVLEKLQVSGERDIRDVSARLVKMGATGLRRLTGMLKDVGEGDDTDKRARFALSGLAYHVTRKGAGRERSVYARTLAAELEGGKLTKQSKGFVVRQLRLAGGRESAEALGSLLLDEELSEYAAQALLSIRKGAAPQFRKALAGAKGATLLIIAQALGVLRDRESVGQLMEAAGSADRDLRLAALWALGNIGDPRAEGPVVKALAVENPYDKARATEAVFLLIDRLIEDGKKEDAARIARGLWEKTTGEENCHIRCAALQALAAAVGSRAMGELRAAMKSEDMHIRAVAAETALMLPGEERHAPVGRPAQGRRLAGREGGHAQDPRATRGHIGPRRGPRGHEGPRRVGAGRGDRRRRPPGRRGGGEAARRVARERPSRRARGGPDGARAPEGRGRDARHCGGARGRLGRRQDRGS